MWKILLLSSIVTLIPPIQIMFLEPISVANVHAQLRNQQYGRDCSRDTLQIIHLFPMWGKYYCSIAVLQHQPSLSHTWGKRYYSNMQSGVLWQYYSIMENYISVAVLWKQKSIIAGYSTSGDIIGIKPNLVLALMSWNTSV